jgi:iron-sulfur cluster assembly protein
MPPQTASNPRWPTPAVRSSAVRVGIRDGGFAGMAYTMEYAEKVEPSDEVIEDKGVRVQIDPKEVLFLLGTEMGYKVQKLAA